MPPVNSSSPQTIQPVRLLTLRSRGNPPLNPHESSPRQVGARRVGLDPEPGDSRSAQLGDRGAQVHLRWPHHLAPRPQHTVPRGQIGRGDGAGGGMVRVGVGSPGQVFEALVVPTASIPWASIASVGHDKSMFFLFFPGSHHYHWMFRDFHTSEG